MDAEFADLIPLFVEEARDRLERLASSVPRLEADPQSVVEAKRELHTLKGAGRMMRIGALAELCHAAEEVLHAARPGMIPLLTRVVDELPSLVESVSQRRGAAGRRRSWSRCSTPRRPRSWRPGRRGRRPAPTAGRRTDARA